MCFDELLPLQSKCGCASVHGCDNDAMGTCSGCGNNSCEECHIKVQCECQQPICDDKSCDQPMIRCMMCKTFCCDHCYKDCKHNNGLRLTMANQFRIELPEAKEDLYMLAFQFMEDNNNWTNDFMSELQQTLCDEIRGGYGSCWQYIYGKQRLTIYSSMDPVEPAPLQYIPSDILILYNQRSHKIRL